VQGIGKVSGFVVGGAEVVFCYGVSAAAAGFFELFDGGGVVAFAVVL